MIEPRRALPRSMVSHSFSDAGLQALCADFFIKDRLCRQTGGLDKESLALQALAAEEVVLTSCILERRLYVVAGAALGSLSVRLFRFPWFDWPSRDGTVEVYRVAIKV